ncbi:mannose-6-phosphate isomerase [Strongylocentrotus purpuratus]|uniref:mannose-6-phosphate isomerase n=1 Tax=Strongylocentrotus purpuratus TaxID=7668 RepID=A0A7M7RBS3_STRPU|nr:mannose-6-phosphate isomerase [Strongylocentrotus purpuratus]|eukprot:XP_780304.2 PREDICTED: mannose-6-phosphate isomerase [Strongylocentrotus purpuratus]
MAFPAVVSLRCAVQQYAWGRIGLDSAVASLSQSSNKDFTLQADQPYAELWMGTHPKGPSIVGSSEHAGIPLGDWIAKQPECLGSKVRAKFGDQLPYLFKVLSVNKSLSIQAHPNKAHAEQLHAERPDKYPDPNHKPEMALALTPFEGMNGFRPVSEIVNFLENVPELRAVVGDENAASLSAALKASDGNGSSEECRAGLKQCLSAIMNKEIAEMTSRLEAMITRLKAEEAAGQDLSKNNGALALRLYSQFPGDVGCFVSYLFNHITLQPGQAMFLGPNEPHAYLSGNCMECMACSDNVVRSGLTPKFKDIPTLCEMLTYLPSTPDEKIFPSKADASEPTLTIYDPPVPDFAVARVKVPADQASYTLRAEDSPSIIIVIEGQGEAAHPSLGNGQALPFCKGSVLFLSANESLAFKLSPANGLLAFRAFCPLD